MRPVMLMLFVFVGSMAIPAMATGGQLQIAIVGNGASFPSFATTLSTSPESISSSSNSGGPRGCADPLNQP